MTLALDLCASQHRNQNKALKAQKQGKHSEHHFGSKKQMRFLTYKNCSNKQKCGFRNLFTKKEKKRETIVKVLALLYIQTVTFDGNIEHKRHLETKKPEREREIDKRDRQSLISHFHLLPLFYLSTLWLSRVCRFCRLLDTIELR